VATVAAAAAAHLQSWKKDKNIFSEETFFCPALKTILRRDFGSLRRLSE